jgi:hypothetical protein
MAEAMPFQNRKISKHTPFQQAGITARFTVRQQ